MSISAFSTGPPNESTSEPRQSTWVAISVSPRAALPARGISACPRRTASAYYLKDYLGAADIVVVDDEFHLHAGGEAVIQKVFRLRAGYMFNYDSKNITAGASFSKRNLTVDYAFVPYSNDLGSSHLFNLTFSL